MKLTLAILLLALCPSLFAETAIGQGKKTPKFLFIPIGHKAFVMTLKDDDTVGSVVHCMDKVHKRGGGTCSIGSRSLKPSKHNLLYRKYDDVHVVLK